MQLFFQADLQESDSQACFPRDESKHIIKVLRKTQGDLLRITNGKGFLFETEILVANPNQCVAKVLSVTKTHSSSSHLHLAVAPTKMNDRYEWFLEKATEIGIQEITPIICDHSERKFVKINRFERVIQTALKQSLQTYLPVLNPAVSFSEFMQKSHSHKKYIAHCEPGQEKEYLKNQTLHASKVTILIGPEGDFSPAEIECALQLKWTPVSLGNHRLRTETAAIVACHTVALANEEMEI